MASEPTVTREMIKAGIEAWAKAANERLDPEHVICAARSVLSELERENVNG